MTGLLCGHLGNKLRSSCILSKHASHILDLSDLFLKYHSEGQDGNIFLQGEASGWNRKTTSSIKGWQSSYKDDCGDIEVEWNFSGCFLCRAIETCLENGQDVCLKKISNMSLDRIVKHNRLFWYNNNNVLKPKPSNMAATAKSCDIKDWMLKEWIWTMNS